MATITAQHHNPAIRAFARRLAAAGKPVKVIRIAGLRKRLTILNTLVRRNESWRDVTATA
jgi:transposase